MDAHAALAAVDDHAYFVASPATGAPDTLLRALGAVADERRRWTLYTGLLLGEYPFLDAVADGRLRYETSHVMSASRRMVASGSVDFLPVRASEVNALIHRRAAGRPLVALVRTTAPDIAGNVSLGVSTAYSRELLDHADVVIAERDDSMPFTGGDAVVAAAQITTWVRAESPLADYHQPEPDGTSDAIADNVMTLLPDHPTLQMGIGAIPEAVTRRLPSADTGWVRLVGMVTDGVVDLDDAGLLRAGAVAPVWGVDLMGTRRLWRWADRNPLLEMKPSSICHDPRTLGQIERLVSVNSAVELDLAGQINAEAVAGMQISGTGGSLDFVEAARRSPGGLSILALPSTVSSSGTSRIVAQLGSGATVTIPRVLADVVVTEYGTADLRHRTLAERAAALIAIAHPDHRRQLADTHTAR